MLNGDHGQRLIDAKQVGVLARMSSRTVYRYADGGLMPWGVKIGHLRRWDAEVVNRWIAEGCRPVRSHIPHVN